MHGDETPSPSSPHEGTDANEARERAEAVKARVERDILALPGVTGIATGPKLVAGEPTATWSIRIYVEHKRDVGPDEALPSDVEGVPIDVVERRFMPLGGAAEPNDERRR